MLTSLPRCRITALNTALSRVLFALLLAGAALPAEAKIYRWVDAQGNVHYSDTLPVRDSGRGNDLLSKDGLVVKHHDSTAQKKAQEAAAAAARVQRESEQKKQRRDQALLATYTTPQEIDLARDRALDNYRLIVKSTQMRLDQVAGNLTELQSRAASFTRANKPVPAYLSAELARAQSDQASLTAEIQQNRQTMAQTRAQYAADKARFIELTGAGKDVPPAP